MEMTFSEREMSDMSARLRAALAPYSAAYPGESGSRQPVHVVYGGAHLFKAGSIAKLGSIALRSFETYAPDAGKFASLLGIPALLAESVYQRVRAKLEREAIEDYRLDFEDGYGIRPDAEEDAHAESAAKEMAQAMAENALPPFSGIRIKNLSEEMHARAIRTLDIFLTTLAGSTGGKLPDNFVVTLPKIVAPAQIELLIDVLEALEAKLGLEPGVLKMEMMIETTQSVIGPDGSLAMPLFARAARGRCTSAHFGAYDYTASCGITAANQDMLHPACDFARHMMQVSLGETGIRLSDGATNIMPIGPHRGEVTPEQEADNREVVHNAWKLHYSHVRHSLENGFYQGWDLHPAQIPTRYAAVYAFFLEGLDAASERLRNFVDKAARATMVGDVFDDAATGQGLLNYFLRAVSCGALTEEEAVERTSVNVAELRSGSFKKILENRRDR